MTDWRIRLRDADRALGSDVEPETAQRLRRSVIVASRASVPAAHSWSRMFVATAATLALVCVALLTALQGVPVTDDVASTAGDGDKAAVAAVTDDAERPAAIAIFNTGRDADHLGVRSRFRSERNSAMKVRATVLPLVAAVAMLSVLPASAQQPADTPLKKLTNPGTRPSPRLQRRAARRRHAGRLGPGDRAGRGTQGAGRHEGFPALQGLPVGRHPVGARQQLGAGDCPAPRLGGAGVRARAAPRVAFSPTASPYGSCCGTRTTGLARPARAADATAAKELAKARVVSAGDRPGDLPARTRARRSPAADLEGPGTCSRSEWPMWTKSSASRCSSRP